MHDYNVTFSDEAEQQLRRLMQATGAETPKDLFNAALTMLGWAVQNVQEGSQIAAVQRRGKFEQCTLGVLAHARRPSSPRIRQATKPLLTLVTK